MLLNDATKEGDTNDPDDSSLAKLWFWRDDRGTEDLTLHFDIGGVADVGMWRIFPGPRGPTG